MQRVLKAERSENKGVLKTGGSECKGFFLLNYIFDGFD